MTGQQQGPNIPLIGGIVAAGAVAIFVIIALVATPLLAVLMVVGLGEQQSATDPCEVGTGAVRSTSPAYTGKRYLGGDQLAATIYSQAHGLGFGDLGALIGIATALSETNGAGEASNPNVRIKNGTVGDTITASNADQFRLPSGDGQPGQMTSSRGIFQQRMGWLPKGEAFSGLPFTFAESKRLYSDFNPLDPSKKLGSNPWGSRDKGTGWAIRDPRMNPAQAANIFFLGGTGGQEGLEEALRKDKRIKRVNDPAKMPSPDVFTDTELGAFSHDVQVSGSPTKAAAFLPRARVLLADINAGRIPVPAFQEPYDYIGEQADASFVSAALGLRDYMDATRTTQSEPTVDIVGDGVTVIGDSTLKHTWGVLGEPETLFGGDAVAYFHTGISLGQVLSGEGVRASDGSKDAQGRRITPTSEWMTQIATGPSRVIVALGTNQGGTREQVDQLLRLAGDSRQVYWLSQHYDNSAAFNQILLEASRDHDNLTIVDTSDIVPVSNNYHWWEGAGKDPSKAIWGRVVEYVAGSRVPTANLSLACGGGSVAIDVPAATGEAAEAVVWALGKYRAGTAYEDNAITGNAGDPTATSFDCSSFVFTAFSQAGLDWTMRTSSNQWAYDKHVTRIPISEAMPGDVIWVNHGGGDGQAAGHVGLIASIEDGVPVMVHAANPRRDVTTDRLDTYGISPGGRGYLGVVDPTKPVSAAGANTTWSLDWRDAWVGRITT